MEIKVKCFLAARNASKTEVRVVSKNLTLDIPSKLLIDDEFFLSIIKKTKEQPDLTTWVAAILYEHTLYVDPEVQSLSNGVREIFIPQHMGKLNLTGRSVNDTLER